MKQNIENKLLKKIRGKGRGWSFSQYDFAHLGTRSAIDVALHPDRRKKVLADTQTATGWIYAAIREICRKDTDGQSVPLACRPAP